ncbi:MAG: transporter, partial [Chloroflexi bacterium]|nr:transporter [Chloroflexota bacterium]
ALLLILTALSPNFTVLLVLRALLGVALAGLPAVAMAYLGEEVQRDSLGVAMGLYISGNSVGGLLGRLLTGMISDVVSWRAALIAIGVIGLFATGVFWRLLPPSRNFRARPFVPRQLAASLGRHLTDPGLLCLYAIAALVMGSFVTLYNYLGYRLTGAPYGLSQSAVGWIFLVYLVGTFSSSWMGGLSGRLGRRPVLVAGVLLMLAGLCLTMSPDLAVIIAGVMVFTFGFFGSHSIASSWVGIRARVDRAQAASLYLLFYYLGSSVCGYGGGLLWSRSAWPGVAALIALLLVCALGVAVRLSRVPPRAAPAVDPTPLQASRSVTVPRT